MIPRKTTEVHPFVILPELCKANSQNHFLLYFPTNFQKFYKWNHWISKSQHTQRKERKGKKRKEKLIPQEDNERECGNKT